MSTALGSLLIGEEIEEKEADQLRDRFPLNARAGKLPDGENNISDRVRLRHALSDMRQGLGLAVSGAEPSQYQQDSVAGLRAQFRQSGSIKGKLLVRVDSDLDDSQLEQIQGALQSHGFDALITEISTISVFNSSFHSIEDIEWLELGCTRIAELDLEKARQWIRADSRFSDTDLLESWVASGVSLEAACQWINQIDDSSHMLKRASRAAEWIQAGVSAKEAMQWERVSNALVNFNLVGELRKTMDPEEAKLWNAALHQQWRGDSLQAARDRGLTGDLLRSFIKLGFSAEPGQQTLNSASDLVGPLMEADQALQWAKLGTDFIRRGGARTWKQHGITIQQAEQWYPLVEKYNLTDHSPNYSSKQVMAWIEAGSSPQQVEPWIILSGALWDLEKVTGWTEAGISPQQAKPWIEIADRFHRSSYDHCDQMYTIQGMRSWTELGAPFDNPQVVERMIQAKVDPEQAMAVAEALS